MKGTEGPARRADDTENRSPQSPSDLDEQLQTDRKLKESEDRYRELADFMPQIVWQTDDRGIIQYVNNRWTELTGIPVSEAIGKPWLPGMMDEDLQRAQEAWAAAQARGGIYEHEWRLRLKDGSLRWLLTRGRPIRDERGTILRWIGTDTDITERRDSEAKLRESEARLELATSAAELGIWDWDLLTNRFVYSPRAKAICGFALDQEVSFQDIVNITHPEDYPLTSAQARRALDPAIRDKTPYEYRIVRPDGAIRRVVAHGSAVFAHIDGREWAVRYVGTLQDVTDRMAAEQALRESKDRMQIALAAGQLGDWTWERSSDRLDLSTRAREIFGIVEIPELTWAGLQKLLDAEDASLAAKAVENAIARNSDYSIEYRVNRPNGQQVWVAVRGRPTYRSDGSPSGMVGVVQDVSERKRHEQHLRLLINELNHRVKNTLATVQSMASLTLRGSLDVEEARTRFEARLIALAGAHDILTRENWEGASLNLIVERAISPYLSSERNRFTINGPEIVIPPKYALALIMALHELCTNAAKYGALSNETGKVAIAWELAGRAGEGELRMTWQERDGPDVTPPSRRGFGSRLIEQGLAQDLSGEVKIVYAASGVMCRIRAPLEPKPRMLDL
ncbi:MAG TPA: PAS domain-containing protein [Aestuariivirgaceae bacterium]|jgi:PAS domain S-box-containing protein